MAIYNSFCKNTCRVLQGTVSCLEGRINILPQTTHCLKQDFVIAWVTEQGRHTTQLIQHQIPSFQQLLQKSNRTLRNSWRERECAVQNNLLPDKQHTLKSLGCFSVFKSKAETSLLPHKLSSISILEVIMLQVAQYSSAY